MFLSVPWMVFSIKAAVLQMLKNYKMKQKLSLNTGQVMFSKEIYYYWPFNLSKKVDKTSFFFA